MAKYGSNSVGFFLVGGYDLKGYATEIMAGDPESLTEPSATLGDTWQEHTPVGNKKCYLSQNGFYDDESGGINAATAELQDTSRVVNLAHEGNTVGKRFLGWAGAFSAKYSRIIGLGKLHKANVAYQTTGEHEQGVILQAFEAETGDGNGSAHDYGLQGSAIDITSSSEADPTELTTDDDHDLETGDWVLIAGHTSTPDINGAWEVTVTGDDTFTIDVEVTVAGSGGTVQRASTRDGGAAYQQVGAFSGFTGYIGKVQHSADSSTWADLATFADVTAARNGQRVAVSGTVRRYTRYVVDVTGSGSLDVFGGFARG